MNIQTSLYVLLFLLPWFACSDEPKDTPAPTLTVLEAAYTGIDFKNSLEMNDSLNLLSYLYFYNGGGVATGDFNQDGLEDLFFVANMKDNKLYLNKGGLQFEDVTDKAAVSGKGFWNTGVSVVDINADGLLDIYVSTVGDYITLKGHNELYICKGIENGIPVFEEESASYGLDFVGFGTQSAFFDMDLDGDLDLFMLNHSTHRNGTFAPKKTFAGRFNDKAGDRLYENKEGQFVDVTATSGIYSSAIGYGLGIAVSDINNDGWPDLYIGNDFHEDDYLYINQKDGTFKDQAAQFLPHTSRFSMGVDIADLNNDGLKEIISLDMHPYEPAILKSSLGEDGYDIFQFKIKQGYQYQYARNALQWNQDGEHYSNIAMDAGIYATEWSWAPLLVDLDNDGLRDVFISNGIPKRMNDIDYLNYFYSPEKNNTIKYDEVLENMPTIKVPNQAFLNMGDFGFQPLTKGIKGNANSFSNGTIYVDLDNDGDVEIVTNNLEDSPFIYENKSVQDSTNAFLGLKLDYLPSNQQAIGAKVQIFKADTVISYENYPTRGFLSSNQVKFTIGLGNSTVDSVILVWPDNTYQTLSLAANAYHTVKYDAANVKASYAFMKAKASSVIQFEKTELEASHSENPFIEFNREPFLPFMVSREGPSIAVADWSGDGESDVLLGSSKRFKPQYLKQEAASFEMGKLLEIDSMLEEASLIPADFNQDGKSDLLVLPGGNEFRSGSEKLRARIYFNEQGKLVPTETALKSINGGDAAVADLNQDGLLDIFLGARSTPYKYGVAPFSYVYHQNSKGGFDLVDSFQLGFVTDVEPVDIDKDGDTDLVVAKEWGTVSILEQNEKQLTEKPVSNQSGWWRHVQVADFDKDGHLDILAGNMGTNSKLQASTSEPIKYYVVDIDKNGDLDQILTHYFNGKEVLLATHNELLKHIPSLKKKYQYAKDFAKATPSDVMGSALMRDTEPLVVDELRHHIFWGSADGFEAEPLPKVFQYSSINASELIESSGSGVSLMTGGNFYPMNIELGRYDASYGNIMRFNGRAVQSLGNLGIKGEIRAIEKIEFAGRPYYLVARNNDNMILVDFKSSTE